ncbi:class I SAM-dependent methyltransferase [Hyphomicrobium sp. CS1GBMeth3]|uniref:class I SAM-dependent methyltransferase n=1 Tax=Hyphomicrobium sp. CS1GBMeth3 TaxID=1892845 RepID=UPI000931BA1C|nr:class I SAM-dependent methyltransferase [Hyphomicrobium sp. CS1GBMeth3]
MLSLFAGRTFPAWFDAWHRRRAFQGAYGRRQWGEGKDGEFFSGAGSRGACANTYVECISRIVESRSKESDRPLAVVDLGCGDFSVGRRLIERTANVRYIGCDIVPELVQAHRANVSDTRASFQELDIVAGDLPDGDIVLVREVLQHLCNADVSRVLEKLGKYKEVYITEARPLFLEGPSNPDKPSGPGVRWDWRTGRGRGIDLDKPPFELKIEEVCRSRHNDLEEVVTFRVSCAS